MRNAMWHVWVGNDAPAWLTAAARALLGATTTAGLAFFNTWAQTDDVRLLVTSFMVPFLLILGGRGVVEGAVDVRKARKKQ